MASSTISSLLLLLVLMFSFSMDEAHLDAQTQIRKLKETMKMRKNLKGSDERSSEMAVQGSRTIRCKGRESFKNMETTYHHDDDDDHSTFMSPVPGRSDSSKSLCTNCKLFSCITCGSVPGANCYTVRCVTTTRCHGPPRKCSTTEQCTRISG